MEEIISLKELVKKTADSYKYVFSQEPELCAFAPGRVNLIGEHTDYNDGFVFPVALPMATVVVGSKSHSDVCKVVTLCSDVEEPKEIEIPLSSLADLSPGVPKWANYVKGVMFFHPKKEKLPAFNAVIASSVPCGSGLSSSAALEVATFTFLDALLDIEKVTDEEKKEKALMCQKAEHQFAGVPCGIMDQMVSSVAKENYAIFIDCRSLQVRHMLFKNPDLAILIINSNVKHDLSIGEYAKRKIQCEEASTVMGLNKLRDAHITTLEAAKELMSKTSYNRAKHVILENLRCQTACDALKENDYEMFGEVMTLSHRSLSEDFEVSCHELDLLVKLTKEIRGVYGSRMTGGGFGGCTVTLLEKRSVDDVVKHLKASYPGCVQFYLCTPSAGAGKIDLSEVLGPNSSD